MTAYGLTLGGEEHPPQKLVDMAVAAEEAGFDFVSLSDHFHPWLTRQGHSPFVWSVLGAVATATERIGVGVGVTCPTVRIHPAILAQATATVAGLMPGRFTWGVGTGEALNEQILGDRWPPFDIRIEMLAEAVQVVRTLWKGESVTFRGTYYTVEDATIFDPPPQPVPIVVSAFGPAAAKVAAEIGDGLWMTGANKEVVDRYRGSGGAGPVWSQLTLCWAEDRDEAIDTAHRQWPNSMLPGQLNQDLRTPLHFEQATQLVTREDVTDKVPCGPDPGPVLETIAEMEKAGADHIYLHQIGDDQDGFLDFWKKELAPELTR
jgi:G6PDH family F420-dependent oxidoreductase